MRDQLFVDKTHRAHQQLYISALKLDHHHVGNRLHKDIIVFFAAAPGSIFAEDFPIAPHN